MGAVLQCGVQGGECEVDWWMHRREVGAVSGLLEGARCGGLVMKLVLHPWCLNETDSEKSTDYFLSPL